MILNDKLTHFVVGLLLTALCYSVGIKDVRKSFLVVLLIAMGKELWDMQTTVQPMEHTLDVLATIAFPMLLIPLVPQE